MDLFRLYGISYYATHIDKPTLLIKDDEDWWTTFTDAFLSSSKHIVSRHPQSCIEEVVLHYCPQCMNKIYPDEYMLYQGRFVIGPLF